MLLPVLVHDGNMDDDLNWYLLLTCKICYCKHFSRVSHVLAIEFRSMNIKSRRKKCFQNPHRPPSIFVYDTVKENPIWSELRFEFVKALMKHQKVPYSLLRTQFTCHTHTQTNNRLSHYHT